MIVTLPKHPSGLAFLNPDRIVFLSQDYRGEDLVTIAYVDVGDPAFAEFRLAGTPSDVAYDINSQAAAS